MSASMLRRPIELLFCQVRMPRPEKKHSNEPPRERGKKQRAYAKPIAGFEHLASAHFVVTDHLRGHILSIAIDVLNVLMGSKLGEDMDFRDTLTERMKDNPAHRMEVRNHINPFPCLHVRLWQMCAMPPEMSIEENYQVAC
ncbi:hypothetical protein BGZ63DRAFT_409174 [Mariannaea sp. PMI_226]|nr:hypothetical protein BGZ63DRAFT_409174 [Mariannaea sp. PMI_226]